MALLLLAAGLLPALSCHFARSARPNIILVLVDTLRADYLGAYGFDGDVSPAVDALARESVLFRNCFSQSPWTKPAVASLFTSLYPQVHGLTNHDGQFWGGPTPEMRTGVLPGPATTLAERLHEQGYATAAFLANPWVGKSYGFAQGFDLYQEYETFLVETGERLLGDASAWIEARDARKPYFLYLHLMDVHAPYRATRDDYAALRPSRSVASERVLQPDEMPDARWENVELRPEWATDAMRRELAYWRTVYAAGVRALDRRLGEFVERLRRAGELDRAVFVLTSDHGEELFEHGDWSHGQNLFDHQLHVPLLIRKPHGRGAGVEARSFVELVDLMPTLLALAGAEPSLGLQGRDISPLLAGGTIEERGITFATATQWTPGLHSARTERHKLVYNIEHDAFWLFDLAHDPGEQREVSGRDPDVAHELRQRLLDHVAASLAGGPLAPESAAVPTELQQRLRALGYLE